MPYSDTQILDYLQKQFATPRTISAVPVRPGFPIQYQNPAWSSVWVDAPRGMKHLRTRVSQLIDENEAVSDAEIVRLAEIARLGNKRHDLLNEALAVEGELRALGITV